MAPHLPVDVAAASGQFQAIRAEAMDLERWSSVFACILDAASAPELLALGTIKRLKGDPGVRMPGKHVKYAIEETPGPELLPPGFKHTAEWLRQ